MTKTNLPNPNSGTDAVEVKNGWHVLAYNPTLPSEHGRSKLNLAISKVGMHWRVTIILENEEEEEEEGNLAILSIVEAEDKNTSSLYLY